MYGTPLIWSLIVVAIVGGIAWMIYSQGQRLDEQGQRISGLELQRDVANGQVRTLAQQLLDNKITPKVTPQPLTSSPVESGADGRDGRDGRAPTQAEIAAAVSRYLTLNPPQPGRPPTMAEILTAVTGYLRANPPPAGPSGAPGKDGTDGADGADGADGKDGAPPTDGQIRAAVEEYLTSHPLACPDGYQAEQVTILTAGGPRQANVCIANSEGP
jgi:hypothetical protein